MEGGKSKKEVTRTTTKKGTNLAGSGSGNTEGVVKEVSKEKKGDTNKGKSDENSPNEDGEKILKIEKEGEDEGLEINIKKLK